VRALEKILASDLPVARKISKLQILALRAFPSSPFQKAVIAAYQELERSNVPGRSEGGSVYRPAR
jgi:hypothetical protein